MNVNQLEWFCRCYEARSIAKASQGAYASRQAVGKAIRSLEAELGVALFTRSGVGVEPTQAAHAVYPFARRCVAEAQLISSTCRDYARAARPCVRIALADGMVDSLPDGFFEDLEQASPDVELIIEKHSFSSCQRLLAEAEADLAIVPGPVGPSAVEQGLSCAPLAQDPLYVAVPAQAVLPTGGIAELADLEGMTFFAIASGQGGRSDEGQGDLGLAQLLAERGVNVLWNRRYSEYEIILRKVCSGQGSALVPRSTARQRNMEGAMLFPFPDDLLKLEVDLLWRADDTTEPCAQVLKEACRLANVPCQSPES